MDNSKPKSIIFFSAVIILLGLMMIGYWTKYVIDGLPLANVPIISEGIAAILALITGVGLYRMRKWSVATGLVLSGLWIYGCVAGINMVIYDLIVNKKLNFQSPIGALTDALLFVFVTIWAVFMAVYLWKNRKKIFND